MKQTGATRVHILCKLCVYVCVCVCVYVCVCVCVSVHIYTYMYIYVCERGCVDCNKDRPERPYIHELNVHKP